MKCEYCPLSYGIMTDCGEEWECGAGFGEPPVEWKDGLNGCRLHPKVVAKLDELSGYQHSGEMPKNLAKWWERYMRRTKPKAIITKVGMTKLRGQPSLRLLRNYRVKQGNDTYFVYMVYFAGDRFGRGVKGEAEMTDAHNTHLTDFCWTPESDKGDGAFVKAAFDHFFKSGWEVTKFEFTEEEKRHFQELNDEMAKNPDEQKFFPGEPHTLDHFYDREENDG